MLQTRATEQAVVTSRAYHLHLHVCSKVHVNDVFPSPIKTAHRFAFQSLTAPRSTSVWNHTTGYGFPSNNQIPPSTVYLDACIVSQQHHINRGSSGQASHTAESHDRTCTV